MISIQGTALSSQSQSLDNAPAGASVASAIISRVINIKPRTSAAFSGIDVKITITNDPVICNDQVRS